MTQSQQFPPQQKFKEFSSSFPPNPFFQGVFKHPGSPKLNPRVFQGLQGVARILFSDQVKLHVQENLLPDSDTDLTAFCTHIKYILRAISIVSNNLLN